MKRNPDELRKSFDPKDEEEDETGDKVATE